MRLLNKQNKHGFTIVEVMCVLVIISIVSSIAMPAINNFHSAERCKSEASVLVSYIRQAKYQALQDNTLNRIIFSKEGSNANAFKVQKYEELDTDGNEKSYVIDNVLSGSNLSYDNPSWVSIADAEEIDFNSSVEVDLSQCPNLSVVYFKPDGFLYKNKTDKISEQRIVFRYGSSAVAVDINALGVISSEAIPNEEDDDFYNDNQKEGDESEDTAGVGGEGNTNTPANPPSPVNSDPTH